MIGAIARGPLLLVLGAVAGCALYHLDKLVQVFHEFEPAGQRLEQSRIVHYLSQDAHVLPQKLGRQADLLRLGLGL